MFTVEQTKFPINAECQQTYEELDQIDAHAYMFWNEATGPEIVVTGVVDGGVYSPPVNFTYLVEDPNEPLWSAFFEGSYPKETKLTQTGAYQLKIFAKDWAMNESNNVINFKIAGPPQVISTDPSDGMSEVDVYGNITISFNKEMDPASVNSGTVQFSPALSGGFTPSSSGDNKTVTLIISDPQKDLKFQTGYTVIVTDGVTDKDNVQLDGDKDGKAGGNSTKFDVDLLRLQNTIENNKEV